jgi:hypothetical protein
MTADAHFSCLGLSRNLFSWLRAIEPMATISSVAVANERQQYLARVKPGFCVARRFLEAKIAECVVWPFRPAVYGCCHGF